MDKIYGWCKDRNKHWDSFSTNTARLDANPGQLQQGGAERWLAGVVELGLVGHGGGGGQGGAGAGAVRHRLFYLDIHSKSNKLKITRQFAQLVATDWRHFGLATVQLATHHWRPTTGDPPLATHHWRPSHSLPLERGLRSRSVFVHWRCTGGTSPIHPEAARSWRPSGRPPRGYSSGSPRHPAPCSRSRTGACRCSGVWSRRAPRTYR